MKISKELKAGFIAIAAIGVFVAGVNFLKGKNFFGGDSIYYAYFANAGNLAPSSVVTLNGVTVGKVLEVKNNLNGKPTELVIISFSIIDPELQLPKGTLVEIGSLDFFNKGIVLRMDNIKPGFYKVGDYLPGSMTKDFTEQAKEMIDPVKQKLELLMGKLDKTVSSFSSFWDETASGQIEESMNEVRISIKRFGSVAEQVEGLMIDERAKLGRIISNVEDISENLKASNGSINKIIGNVTKLSNDLVSSDFKAIIGDATKTLRTLNAALEDAAKGKGTLGKLLYDEALYNSLVQTNQEVQNLLSDLQLHPERYIHFSVLGARTKGVPISKMEEKKLRKLLDSIPN